MYVPDGERRTLEQCGYCYEDCPNYLVDLQRPKEEIWRLPPRSCRAEIWLSQNRGVRIDEETNAESVDVAYELIQLSYERGHVPLADRSLFHQALHILAPRACSRSTLAI